MREAWRDIVGYEGLYKISNHGRIISFVKSKMGRIIDKNYSNPNNYKKVILVKNGTQKHLFVHRLVAITFICNKYGHKYVNHKDSDKHNNNDYNLEWCSHSYNMKHSYKSGFRKNNKGSDCKLSKSIVKTDILGNILEHYGSMREASRVNNCSIGSISECCNNKIESHKGYKWKIK